MQQGNESGVVGKGCHTVGTSGHHFTVIHNHSHALSHALRGYLASHVMVFDVVCVCASPHMVSRGCCSWSHYEERSWRMRFCPLQSTERFVVCLWKRFWSMCCQNSACPVCDWLSAHQRSQSSFSNWTSRGWVNDDLLETTSWVIKVFNSSPKMKMTVFLIFVCVTLPLCVSYSLVRNTKWASCCVERGRVRRRRCTTMKRRRQPSPPSSSCWEKLCVWGVSTNMLPS